MYKASGTLFLILLIAISTLKTPPANSSRFLGSRDQPQAARTVFLASGLSDQDLISLSANLSASENPGIFLIDSPKVAEQNGNFLKEFQSDRIIPVGSFPDEPEKLRRRLGARMLPPINWRQNLSAELWRELFPRAERVILCPVEPRPALLQAACLAGALKAPLYITTGLADESHVLHRLLAQWQIKEIYAVGNAAQLIPRPDRRNQNAAKLIHLRDEETVASTHRRHLRRQGKIETLVLCNPADGKRGLANLSALAPWIAIQHRAALLLTSEKGDDAGAILQQALKTHDLCHAESLILIGNLNALPMEKRPNPVAGKDAYIEMEPLTPSSQEPFTLATGRLFADDLGWVTLQLARQRLLRESAANERETLTRPKALVVSNPSGGLPLLEAFSRNTAQELANQGYEIMSRFGSEVNPDDLRRRLPEQDVFLWEGHYATLMKEYKMHEWTEPMKPSLVFLQSCLALADGKAQPFLERGAVAVIGTSTRTYSATGGACALAFFDALLYDRQTVGGALRSAKNFLLVYSLLKQKRLGKDAKLMGANLRSAWAFSLWGDPTLKLPQPDLAGDNLPPVRHEVHGHTIVVSLPGASHRKAISSKYRAQMPPNGRLAGLITPDEDDEDIKHLIPFIFIEVHLPKAPPDVIPRLHSLLPESRWVFGWDARRKCGHLLFMPRAKDRDELRFYIDWNGESVARSQ